MRQYLRLGLALVLILGLGLLARGGYQAYAKEKNKQRSQNLSQSAQGLMAKQAQAPDQTDQDLADQVIGLYEKEYGVDNIAGVVEVGGGLIREPAIVDPDMAYLRKLPNGKPATEGTVIIHGGSQTSSADNYAAYYGHGMKNGSRFGPLLSYKKDLEKLKTARIYSRQGIRQMKLISFSLIKIDFFDPIPMTDYQGVQDYLARIPNLGQVIYQEEADLGPDDFVATLSTCAVYGGRERIVAIYKEVK